MAKAMTNLKQIAGGDTIKQGDTSSVFAFELQDSDNQKMAITGTGRLILEGDIVLAMHKEVEVVDGQFSFTLDEDTPHGSYLLSLSIDGYVFPTNKLKIRIRKNLSVSDLIPAVTDPKFQFLIAKLKKAGIGQSADIDTTAIDAKFAEIDKKLKNQLSPDELPFKMDLSGGTVTFMQKSAPDDWRTNWITNFNAESLLGFWLDVARTEEEEGVLDNWEPGSLYSGPTASGMPTLKVVTEKDGQKRGVAVGAAINQLLAENRELKARLDKLEKGE